MIRIGPNPPLFATFGTQQKSTILDFGVDNGSQFAATADGTQVLTANWNTAATRLELSVGTAGGQNSYSFTSKQFADVIFEVDVSQAVAGGLVWRWQDQSNYYLLGIDDDTNTTGNNLVVYRRVAGTFTAIGSINLTFVRGTKYKVRVEMVGSAIKIFWNDLLAINITDANITAQGRVGFRQNQLTASHYHSFSARSAGVSSEKNTVYDPDLFTSPSTVTF